MLSDHAALLSLDSLHAPFAQCLSALPALAGQQGQWTTAQFLGHVTRLAERLPSRQYAINLCENRYLFMVAFCAVIVRGQTNLLPQNRALSTQSQLLGNYASAFVLHDGQLELPTGAPQFNVNEECLLGEPVTDIPLIPLDLLAAVAFTSGSTGQPKANLKSWRTFVDSSRMNARYMLPVGRQSFSMLATVPPQHMWGLETSVLLPLLSRACIADSRPLFPQDVVNRLNSLAAPRILVSTPVHLRALIRSGIELPVVERILCATAPLTSTLAEDVERAFRGELIEIYGCSEVGSMARRRTALEEDWTLFEGLEFTTPDQAGQILVKGDHLPCCVPMTDHVVRSDERQFRLLGRGDDMLEVAGKRGSLQELNKLLLAAQGVIDGVVFMPEVDGQAVARPAAMVVADGTLSKEALTAHFSAHLDPVFIPRPMVFVDAIPREDSGKLQRGNLLALWHGVQQRQQKIALNG